MANKWDWQVGDCVLIRLTRKDNPNTEARLLHRNDWSNNNQMWDVIVIKGPYKGIVYKRRESRFIPAVPYQGEITPELIIVNRMYSKLTS